MLQSPRNLTILHISFYITYLHPEDNTCHYYCQHETTSEKYPRYFLLYFVSLICVYFARLQYDRIQSEGEPGNCRVLQSESEAHPGIWIGVSCLLFIIHHILFFNKDFYIIPVNLSRVFFLLTYNRQLHSKFKLSRHCNIE